MGISTQIQGSFFPGSWSQVSPALDPHIPFHELFQEKALLTISNVEYAWNPKNKEIVPSYGERSDGIFSGRGEGFQVRNCLRSSLDCPQRRLLNIPEVYFPSFIPGFTPPWDGLKSFKEAMEG